MRCACDLVYVVTTAWSTLAAHSLLRTLHFEGECVICVARQYEAIVLHELCAALAGLLTQV
jgi:hypothetical protein